MSEPYFSIENRQVRVVGSIGNVADLQSLRPEDAAAACDVIELRLDLHAPDVSPQHWAHLRGIPLLMTARSEAEGGASGLGDMERLGLLEMALPDAAALDLEVASIGMARDFLKKALGCGVPWVASFHNFERTPDLQELRDHATTAREAGASVFKVAAMISTPGDLARLADFQMEDHGIAVATMGMGRLAVVSRLLCAQSGSVLNYGYIGGTPTAPGQWSAAELKSAITRLPLR